VFAVDRQERGVRPLSFGHHELAGHDQCFFVGQRDFFARPQRFEQRAKADSADDCGKHDVGRRPFRQFHKPFQPRKHQKRFAMDLYIFCADLARVFFFPDRDRLRLIALDLLPEAAGIAVRAEGHDPAGAPQTVHHAQGVHANGAG
jgi:hypothetical protein